MRKPVRIAVAIAFEACLLAGLELTAPLPAAAQSVRFTVNGPLDSDYGRQTVLPPAFGVGEFTFELWIRPDTSFPVGSTRPEGSDAQRTNWTAADVAPYSANDWWYEGNFLLDGHNNASFSAGTFSLQFYGGGRVRWLLGDGDDPGPGGLWSVGAYPAATGPSVLDGNWHQITLVRRWAGASQARLEMWIDGSLVDTETSSVRTDMRQWWSAWSGFPASQEGWFWGAEKQAAIDVLPQYEDYKGLVDEVRFWSRAKAAGEIAADYARAVTGTEPGLAGAYSFGEGAGTSACDSLLPSRCITFHRMKAGSWTTQDPPLANGPGPSGPLRLHTTTPCRLVDTRSVAGPGGGPALSANATRTFPVAGVCGVPPSAKAVVLNVTVVGPQSAGNLRLFPAGSAVPGASAINFSPGQVRANSAVVRLSATGQLAVFAALTSGTTHVVLDASAYLEGEASEEPELGDPALARIESGELVEGGVEVEHVHFRGVGGDMNRVEGHPRPAARSLEHAVGAGAVHQDATHDLGGDGEELRPVPPHRAPLVDQAKVGLVDQGRGLQGVVAALAAQSSRGPSPKLVVDERHQAVARALIPLAPCLE